MNDLLLWLFTGGRMFDGEGGGGNAEGEMAEQDLAGFFHSANQRSRRCSTARRFTRP